VVFGCASVGGAARLPAGEIHEQGERDDDRSDQVCDQRFVSAFPRARRAIASRPARKLVNIEAA
jgi:hypothetical protein